MSCNHYNEIFSHQVETLVIHKIIICNKIKCRDHSVENRFQNCYVYHRQNQSGLEILTKSSHLQIICPSNIELRLLNREAHLTCHFFYD